MNNMLEISRFAFLIAFLLYCVSFITYAVAVMGRTWRNRVPEEHQAKWGKISFVITVIGLISQMTYFICRWIFAGRVPVSNMYEFMTFLSMMIIIAFVVVYSIYRKTIIGLFAVPLGLIIMAYAAVFPSEVQPLIPSLQSIWLQIHVTFAATGESFFAVGFVAALMYLLRTVNFSSQDKKAKRQQRWVEFTLFSIIIIVGFIASVFAFRASGYEVVFNQQKNDTVTEVVYYMPPIVAPYNSTTDHFQSFLGMSKPLFHAPDWMNGANAGRKFNTVIWSIISGVILYGLLRLIARKPLGKAVSPALDGIDSNDLDEISYRAIAIGFPIFTLGALIFAMIWAQQAWGRFWGWDPKEVWALITWLYYSAYLHLRLSRGFEGRKSAWIAVIGFLVVMFTLVGVNLVIAGLHSYAGTD